jgi:hypothetical protein
MRTRETTRTADGILLPPPFRLITLREVGDAFAFATANAAAEGAGTLVQVGRFDLSEFALVLEPDEKLREARRTLYACMAALADAIAVQAPPETAVTIAWPDAIYVNGGLVGGGRIAWPEGTGEDETPDWIVFAAMIRLVSLAEGEAGLFPLSATLEDEGFDGNAAERIVETFARHLMSTLDAWQSEGFPAVARSYLERLDRTTEKGLRRDISDNGDLIVRRTGKTDTEQRSFVSALAMPSWLDPASGGPKL